MSWITNAFGSVSTMFSSLHFSVSDFIDIIIMSYLFYKAAQIIRETRATQLFKGIILLCLSFVAAKIFRLQTLDFLFTNLFQIGLLVLIVLFQPELRRVLERMGRAKVSTVLGAEFLEKNMSIWQFAIPIIIKSVKNLSKTQTGALIVIERQTRLGEQIATGVELNAKPSTELFGNIFFMNSPLHDGAVIMRNGRIYAAACFLPKPQQEDWISTHLGSRHRAAIGISEVSDAITIIVSEQTGTISVAENGELERGYSIDRLNTLLEQRLVLPPEKNKRRILFQKPKKQS